MEPGEEQENWGPGHTPASDAPTAPLLTPTPLFLAGNIVIRAGAAAALKKVGLDMMALVERHVRLDPGLLAREDISANRWNMAHGERVLSEYALRDGTPVWLITEADRSATTILLPEEYPYTVPGLLTALAAARIMEEKP